MELNASFSSQKLNFKVTKNMFQVVIMQRAWLGHVSQPQIRIVMIHFGPS